MTSEGLHGLVAAAHELKTPLALISHLAQALTNPALTPTDRQLLVERIDLSAQRSLKLVQGLTLVQRLEDVPRLTEQFRLEPINVSYICQQVLHELSPLAAAHGQQLQARVPQRPRLALANAQLLQTICYNLVENAIRYGGTATPAILLSVTRQQATIRLGVHDGGPPLPRTDLRQLHQRLGRQAQPLSNRPGSSGLGLYVASRMAAAMGGSIGVTHRKSGMEFYARLIQSRQLPLL